MIAISWNQKGPAGATGPAGPAGPAGPKGDTGATGPAGPAGLAGPTGATGAAGPAGAAGSAGKDGNTVLSGTGPPASTVGSDGDFYIDTAASVLYGPKANGTWPAAGTSLVGPAGAEGPAGPQGPSGPQGPPGSGGVSSVTDFNGITCTTDGGAVGTVTASTAGDNTVTLTCGAPPTDPNCTHSTGVQGLTYGDCNDLLGDPTTGTGYNQVMADLAARALQRITNGPLLPDGVDSCGDKVSVALFANGTVVEWTYQATRNVLALTQAGEVHTETFNAYQAGQGANPPNTGECPNASDPKWN